MALSDLADFPLHRYAHEFMLPRIWELRANFDTAGGHIKSEARRRSPADLENGGELVLCLASSPPDLENGGEHNRGRP
jgi:hypothetical protein